MIKSLRWRLQLWYTGLLLVVVAGFGAILYYRARTAKVQEIDAQLEASAHYLDVTLRRLGKPAPPPPAPPPRPRDPQEKKPPKSGPPDGKKKGSPPERSPDELLQEVRLPPGLEDQAGTRERQRLNFAIWQRDGSLLRTNARPENVPAPLVDGGTDFHEPLLLERGTSREFWMRGPDGTLIVVGKSLVDEWAALHAFGWQLVGIGVAVLVVGLLGGYALASRIFRPLAAMSAAAAAISASNLSSRIDTANIDNELADLAQVLNAMFARLEAAFTRQQQFTADASHELRTPLTILRTNAELALSQTRSAEEYRQTIESCLRAANRMAVLVQGLLTLARADAGNLTFKRQAVSLDQVVMDCLAQLRPLAEGKGVTMTADVCAVIVSGEPTALTQVATNLLSNAIQYNRPGGTVHVQLSVAADTGLFTVTDNGTGIPDRAGARIFERFFRVDKSRARHSGGTGLGLAICKNIVEAHGGTIDFVSRTGEGTTFRVTLPRA